MSLIEIYYTTVYNVLISIPGGTHMEWFFGLLAIVVVIGLLLMSAYN